MVRRAFDQIADICAIPCPSSLAINPFAGTILFTATSLVGAENVAINLFAGTILFMATSLVGAENVQ